jgi:hypothetical protein
MAGAVIIPRLMSNSPRSRFRALFLSAILVASLTAGAVSEASWNGVLLDSSGKPAAEAAVKLHSTSDGRDYAATSAANGKFAFGEVTRGTSKLSATTSGKEWKAPLPLVVTDGAVLTMSLQMSVVGQELRTVSASAETSAQASGGEHLSSKEVSSLPLNARDFSKYQKS